MVSQPRFPAVHMKAATGDAALVHLIREGLTQALAADCIDLVLALALSRGCLERVPSGGERLRRFLVGPLTDAMEGFVGALMAASTVDVLQEMLAPMLAQEEPEPRSNSGVRVRSHLPQNPVHAFPEPDTTRFAHPGKVERSDEPTLRLGMSTGLTVILVTRDASASGRLKLQLDATCGLVTADEVFSLMEAMKAAGKQRTLLVFDCRLTAIAPSMMMSVAARIPETAQVILWGSPKQIDEQVSGLGRYAANWTRCNEEALAEDIGALIATALSRCA